jgi:hypothetical protein
LCTEPVVSASLARANLLVSVCVARGKSGLSRREDAPLTKTFSTFVTKFKLHEFRLKVIVYKILKHQPLGISTQAVKTAPHINLGKGATTVLRTVKFQHQPSTRLRSISPLCRLVACSKLLVDHSSTTMRILSKHAATGLGSCVQLCTFPFLQHPA